MFHRPTHDRFRSAAPALLAAAALLIFAAPAAFAQGLPAIATTPTTLDYGVMEQHEAKSQDLTISNVGDIDLLIRRVTSSCGCTAAAPAKEKLAPGESTVIAVTFNSESYQGEQLKYLDILSNDPRKPKLEIPIKAMVHVPVITYPPKGIRLINVRAGSEVGSGVVFSTMDVEKLELKPVRWNKDLFSFRIYENYQDKPNQTAVYFTFAEDAPRGSFNEIVRFETNVPGQAFLDYDVKGEVVSDISINPDRVNFRYAREGQEMVYILRVRPHEKKYKFQITGAEIDLPGFRVDKITPRPNQGSYEVRIVGLPLSSDDPLVRKSRGRMQGTLTIRTDSDQTPELQAKVTYLLKL